MNKGTTYLRIPLTTEKFCRLSKGQQLVIVFILSIHPVSGMLSLDFEFLFNLDLVSVLGESPLNEWNFSITQPLSTKN